MQNEAPPKKFPGSTPVRVLTLALLAQCAIFYGFSRTEYLPPSIPLKEFPTLIGNWQMAQEGTVDPEVLEVLKADDVVSRIYQRPGTILPVNLFVAFFRSQRTGKAPHSPKNCLPGNGWVESSADQITINITGRTPIRVNRYITARGDMKAVVLYWYQSRSRVVPGEFEAKFWVIADAIRYNRTDTSLVRVWVPVAGDDLASSSRTAVEFVQTIFNPLHHFLPS